MREFLALPLPDELRNAARRAAELLAADLDGWRLTREEGLHVTIRFLGEIGPERQALLESSWRLAAAGTGPLELRLSGARLLPSAGRPRVLALGVLDEGPEDALMRLASRVEAAARRDGFPPEPRPFSGHVTVGRVRRGARAEAPPIERVGELGAFVADRLVLFSSELAPGGPRYRELASFPLVAWSGA